MSEDRTAVAIRDAFDSTYVASPGLEDRVVSAIPWERPRDAATSMPRLAGAAAATIAVLAVGILLAPTLLSRLNILFPGTIPAELPAYSLAAVSGDSVFVVQRGGIGGPPNQPAGNVLTPPALRPLVMVIAVAGLPSSVVKVSVTGTEPLLTTALIDPLGDGVTTKLLFVVAAYGIMTEPVFAVPELAL